MNYKFKVREAGDLQFELCNSIISPRYRLYIDGHEIDTGKKARMPFDVKMPDGSTKKMLILRSLEPFGPPQFFVDDRWIFIADPLHWYDYLLASITWITIGYIFVYSPHDTSTSKVIRGLFGAIAVILANFAQWSIPNIIRSKGNKFAFYVIAISESIGISIALIAIALLFKII